MSESNETLQPELSLAQELDTGLQTPEDVERYDAAVAATFEAATEEETPPEPAPEAPVLPVEAAPPSPESPPAPQLPAYLQDIPEADRKAVLESWIGNLTPQERAALAPVNELLTQVAATERQRGAEQATRQTVDQSAREQLQQAARSFVERIRPIVGDQLDVNGEVDNIVNHAQAQIASQVTQGLVAVMNQGGIKQIPQAILDQAAKAENAYQATVLYANFLARTAYQQGLQAGEGKGKEASKKDDAANEVVWRQKHLAELDKAGRLKGTVPPAIGNGVPAGSGLTPNAYKTALEKGDLPSEADIDAMTARIFAGVG